MAEFYFNFTDDNGKPLLNDKGRTRQFLGGFDGREDTAMYFKEEKIRREKILAREEEKNKKKSSPKKKQTIEKTNHSQEEFEFKPSIKFSDGGFPMTLDGGYSEEELYDAYGKYDIDMENE